MSDEPPFLPSQPQLMSAAHARNLARHYQGFAEALRRDGYTREASLAERDAQRWITYALSQEPPLMNAAKARDIARDCQGMATHLRKAGDTGAAQILEQRSAWWAAYAVRLSQTPPDDTTDPGGSGS